METTFAAGEHINTGNDVMSVSKNSRTRETKLHIYIQQKT